ncbi:DNA methyltransferase [Paenibacillus sp. USHLN196]|uniref:DNA methyltransferase n=1 Tax=Paenibacillus sp. USHLN196 TaxID=3081291 RepID=UPI003017BDE2
MDKVKLNDEPEIFKFFKDQFKLNKKQVLSLKESTFIPHDREVLDAFLKYLDLSELELSLMLGVVPIHYQDTYLKHIKDIAYLLEKNTDLPSQVIKPNHKNTAFFSTPNGILYNGDVMEMFHFVEDESIDLIFADPPFNLNKSYDAGVNDKKSVSDYINWCIQWLNECVRVLKPGGSIFIYNLPKWNSILANHLNHSLKFYNMITVDMKHSLPITNRLYPSHYSLLYYVKGDRPKSFNNQRIPLQTCRHCGGEIKDYGGYKRKMNSLGVNISDVWTDIYPVRHSNSKNRDFNELPIKLLDRVITIGSNEGDTILDPFGGSGSTLAVAELLSRKWVGFELGNCGIIQDRISNNHNDLVLLEKIYAEKNKLFPEKARKLRKKNNFWLPEDFELAPHCDCNS